MIRNYLHWKKQQSERAQWFLCLLEKLLFFGIVFIGFGYFVEEEGAPWQPGKFAFEVSFMALLWTLTDNWALTRKLFARNKNIHQP